MFRFIIYYFPCIILIFFMESRSLFASSLSEEIASFDSIFVSNITSAEEIEEEYSKPSIDFCDFSKLSSPKASKALPLWLSNAVKVSDPINSVPMIAIVFDDLGMDEETTKQVLSLSPPLTTSFLYYAKNIEIQTAQARKAGHELLVHIPMEPLNKRFNTGYGTLQVNMSKQEILEQLDAMLSSFSGYVGINNHMGSRFTANSQVMRTVLQELKNRGLLFLDSLTSPDSTGEKTAMEIKLPFAFRTVFLDNIREKEHIENQLSLLEEQARRNGFAVGIGHPHPVTIESVREWIPLAKKRGFHLVPVSSIALFLQNEQLPKKENTAVNDQDR